MTDEQLEQYHTYEIHEKFRGEWQPVKLKGTNKTKTVNILGRSAEILNKFQKHEKYVLVETEVGFDKLTVKELKAYAEDNGIELGDATKKDDILAIVKGSANS